MTGDSGMATTTLDWSNGAACRGSEGSLFYSADSAERKEDRLEREQLAKRICSGCARCATSASMPPSSATSPTESGVASTSSNGAR
jgi:hypothetical protein